MRSFLRVNFRGAMEKLIREGRTFRGILRELEESQWFSREELEELQNRKLRRTIHHAYENVPYYRTLFDTHSIKPSDIETKEDLPKIPLLTKDEVKQNLSSLLARNSRKLLLNKGYTSGTTGTPAKFYRDLYSINFENACIRRHWHWGGFSDGDRRVTLRGEKIVPVERSMPPFWRENLFGKQLLMSSYHLSERNMPAYIEKIGSYRPRMLQAYPSTVYLLARYLQETDQKLEVPLVYTGSEPLYGVQRELIEERLGAEVFDFYGLAERTIFASECKRHEGLHLNPEYGVPEIVDEDGQPVRKGPGRLVGTTLNNFAMPLIRYLTDDATEFIEGRCGCGREFPRIRPVETKCEDMILTPDGREVSASLITFCFKPLFNIRKSQIVQDEPGRLRVRIVRGKDYSDEDSNLLISRLKEATAGELRVDLEFVEDIPRTKAGKYRWIISEVKRERG